MPASNPYLDVMMHATRTAGAQLLRRFHDRAALLIEYKNPGDLVSVADRESEDTILGILDAAYPDFGVMGEEGSSRPANQDGYYWIIDPLDSTSNFLFGVPFWCVTMALAKGDQIVAGVTYDPVHDEMYTASLGGGAFCNGQPIHTSAKTDLKQCAIGLDIAAPPHPLMGDYVHAVDVSLAHCATGLTQRCCGLSMAYLAIGRLDVFAHFGRAKPWDMAAGWLLITEAGGILTDIHQKALHLESGSLLCAAHPSLYESYRALLQRAA
jgi:myo-inositol-1(or 4)-monophosphatase